MTRQRHTFLDVQEILRVWIEDAEATIQFSTSRENIKDPAYATRVRELKVNLPKAKRALKELN